MRIGDRKHTQGCAARAKGCAPPKSQRLQGVAWNDENVKLLKGWWAMGLSASQIAGRLPGISREAVLGKVRRLGLPFRKTTVATPRLFRSTASGNVRDCATFAPHRPRYFESAPSVQLPLPLIPPAEQKSLLDLDENDCRWPCSETKPFTFCGRPKAVKGIPYCEDHMRVAYVPLPPRRQAPVAPSTAPEVIRMRLVEKVA